MTKNEIKINRLIWSPTLLYGLIVFLALSWFFWSLWILWTKIEDQFNMTADKPRYETVEKIILDGRGGIEKGDWLY